MVVVVCVVVVVVVCVVVVVVVVWKNASYCESSFFLGHCFKTEDGGYCVIPFIYKGKMYHGCTENDEGKLWCATTSNYDIDQQGAKCKGRNYL